MPETPVDYKKISHGLIHIQSSDECNKLFSKEEACGKDIWDDLMAHLLLTVGCRGRSGNCAKKDTFGIFQLDHPLMPKSIETSFISNPKWCWKANWQPCTRRLHWCCALRAPGTIQQNRICLCWIAIQKGGVLFATCSKMLAIPKVSEYQMSVDQVDREWDVYQICSRTLVPTCFLSDSPLYSFFWPCWPYGPTKRAFLDALASLRFILGLTDQLNFEL